MDYIEMEYTVSNSDRLPHMDMSYDPGKGYNAISELMRAMILRTVDDYNSGGDLKKDALQYLFSDDNIENEDYIFSFISICRYLGFDPGKTRAMIIKRADLISTRRRAA